MAVPMTPPWPMSLAAWLEPASAIGWQDFKVAA
jgi:hypothetical protein